MKVVPSRNRHSTAAAVLCQRWPFSASVNRISMKQFQLPFSSFAGKRLRQLELLLMSAYHKKKNEEVGKRNPLQLEMTREFLQVFTKVDHHLCCQLR